MLRAIRRYITQEPGVIFGAIVILGLMVLIALMMAMDEHAMQSCVQRGYSYIEGSCIRHS